MKEKERYSTIKVTTLKKKFPKRMQEVMYRDDKLKVIEKMELYSTCYPEIEINQFDLCSNLDEDVGLWLKVSCTIKKKDLFSFIQTVASNFELNGEERLPAKITIETSFKDIKKDEERYAGKLRRR